MPTKKRRAPQGPSKSDYRRWRGTLKSQGLFGKRVSLSKPVTAAEKRTIKRYRDVIEGKAKVISVPKKQAAKFRREYGFKGKGETLIVPKKKGERITFNTKTGEITAKKGDRAKVFESEFKSGKIIPGTRLFYTIYFHRGAEEESYSFEDFNELKSFMMTYEKDRAGPPRRKGWKNWKQYVVREYLDNEEINERKEEGFVVKGKPKTTNKRKHK